MILPSARTIVAVIASVVIVSETLQEDGSIDLLFPVSNDVFKEEDTILYAKEPDDDTPDELDGTVKFRLYTRSTINNPELSKKNGTVIFDGFVQHKPVKVLIHGWKGHANSQFNIDLINGYLPQLDYNVITVDWTGLGSRAPLYPVSRRMVPVVADRVSVFLQALGNVHGAGPADLHLIGHSLGAHVAGIVGSRGFNGTLARVTGLDPAGPYFTVEDVDGRLSTRSAVFVDVIHTAADFLGLGPPLGHADFYPNGGHVTQPGCGPDFYGMCSHLRCYKLFQESILYPCTFQAVSCQNWGHFKSKHCNLSDTAFMGESASPTARGVYYLATNSQSPFSKGTIWKHQA